MKKNSKIYIAVHEGCLGRAIVKKLQEKGFSNLLLKKLDLTSQRKVESFFQKEKPEYVFLPAAKTGGIFANSSYPADFIYQNLASEINIIHSAFKYGTKKMLYLGSACSYPKICKQPIKEEYLLQTPLEPTNEPYAIAKIAGIKMCQSYNRQYKINFICAIPTNFYGSEDDFTKGGHVISCLIRKFHEEKAKKSGTVKIWGTGKPKREFLFVDDVAEACIFLMENYDSPELINIAGGYELSIKKLAETLKKISGFQGKIVYETDKPDGMPRRLLDSTNISNLGWRPKTSFLEGLKLTYEWYEKNHRKPSFHRKRR
ncbi:MAG: GDP-L-fucose synthase [Candidatus Azambacteria bacterium]|nr:GDP-L-fucose synthase [Candidatus Azambacteria bacterium]